MRVARPPETASLIRPFGGTLRPVWPSGVRDSFAVWWRDGAGSQRWLELDL